MSDEWYETGQRRPRVSSDVHQALGIAALRAREAKNVNQYHFTMHCGCMFVGARQTYECMEHRTGIPEYVIQEEP